MSPSATSRNLTMLLVLLLLAGGLAVSSSEEDDSSSSSVAFTDQWAVHISGGDQVADAIAARHGFTNLGKVNNPPAPLNGNETHRFAENIYLIHPSVKLDGGESVHISSPLCLRGSLSFCSKMYFSQLNVK